VTAIEPTRVYGSSGARFMARRAYAWVAAAAATDAAGTTPLVDLADDELDRAAAPHIVEATVAALERGETHYTDRAGIPPLRAAVAARVAAEDGVTYVPQGEVLICGGGREALFVAIQMLVESGDEVLMPDLAPAAFVEGVRLAGGVPVLVPTRAAEGFALRAEAVAARITPRTRLLLLASPAAPSGGVTTGADLAALAELICRHGLYLIWDETYRDYAFGVERRHPATLPGMWERTIVVGSFSTRYAMAGWRAGYILGPAPLLRTIAMLKQSLTICSPAPSQWAALAALTGPQDEAEAAVREVATRRATALRALDALGLACGGAGTPYLFVGVRGLGVTGGEFADAALREAGVRVLSGDVFGAAGTGFVRLTLGVPTAILALAIERLAPLVGRLRDEAGRTGGH